MDLRLLAVPPSRRCAESLLHPDEPEGWVGGRQLRPSRGRPADSPQGPQGRLTPVRAELLPALPPRVAARPAGRDVHEPHRLSLRGPGRGVKSPPSNTG